MARGAEGFARAGWQVSAPKTLRSESTAKTKRTARKPSAAERRQFRAASVGTKARKAQRVMCADLEAMGAPRARMMASELAAQMIGSLTPKAAEVAAAALHRFANELEDWSDEERHKKIRLVSKRHRRFKSVLRNPGGRS
ncbi:MAG: hypothetical protein JWM74_5696 [Myxococcaceae bacterium]|nr:hypothetical protein [Myxococcaceae bacterium]